MKRSLVLVVVLSAGCNWEQFGPAGPFRDSIPDPIAEFSEITSLTVPATATIVASGDTHGGFHGDGELFIVLDVGPDVIQKWLDSPPPWGHTAWQSGPVPDEILGHCLDLPRETIPTSGAKYIVAKDHQVSSIAWHNGQLLILYLEQGRAILSDWDF